MSAETLELAGLLVACTAAGAAIVVRDERGRSAAMLLALLVAPVVVLGDVWNDPRIAELRSDSASLAVGLAVAAALVAAGAVLIRRVEWALAVLAFAVLPLRVPVQIGGETANLLLPLYLVIAAGVAARLGFRRNASPRPDGGEEPQAARALRWLLAATLVLYAIQATYSEDVSNAIENACFFLVPFAVLFCLLVEARWTPRRLGMVLIASCALATIFAAVAFWQYATRDLIFNQDLLDANQIHLYFRVNSLFFDPNVLGRYLALTIVALAAFVTVTRRRREALAATGLALVLLAALGLSFSMTSIAALVAGLIIVCARRFGAAPTGAALGLAAVATAVFLLAGGVERSELGPSRGLEDETSGRVDLVSGGIDLALDQPLSGWGSGSFGAAFAREIERAQTTTSHSEPITVAAEQGAIGVLLYLTLLGVSLYVLLGAPAPRTVGSAAVAGCYVALIVHSLGYAGFVVDPATWALLAVGIALTRPVADEL